MVEPSAPDPTPRPLDHLPLRGARADVALSDRDGTLDYSGLEAAIGALVAELAKRKWPVDQVPVAADAVERGRRRAAELACESCHGEDFMGAGDVPRTAGQQPGYLARQIAAFGVGHRWHPPTGTGARMHVLEASEARDIAAYLHSRPTRKPSE